MEAGSDHDPERIRAHGDDDDLRPSDGFSVEVDRGGAIEGDLGFTHPTASQIAVWEMGAGPGPTEGHHPLTGAETTLGDVEQCVTRVGPWTEIEIAEPLGVHDHGEPTVPSALTGNRVGHEMVSFTIGDDHTEVDRNLDPLAAA